MLLKYGDAKGFIDNELTPELDKLLYCEEQERSHTLIIRANAFFMDKFKANIASDKLFCQVVTGASMHRGYFCPSPVHDLIVGNVKRGKLLKRPSIKSKITHQCYFNNTGKLVRTVEWINNTPALTEDIVHEEGSIYGFTVDNTGNLYCISEEKYDKDGKLIRYALSYCQQKENECFCSKQHSEQYRYDTQGLLECDVIDSHFDIGYISNVTYCFERENGYLTSYKCISHDSGCLNPVYSITVKRKA